MDGQDTQARGAGRQFVMVVRDLVKNQPKNNKKKKNGMKGGPRNGVLPSGWEASEKDDQ